MGIGGIVLLEGMEVSAICLACEMEYDDAALLDSGFGAECIGCIGKERDQIADDYQEAGQLWDAAEDRADAATMAHFGTALALVGALAAVSVLSADIASLEAQLTEGYGP